LNLLRSTTVVFFDKGKYSNPSGKTEEDIHEFEAQLEQCAIKIYFKATISKVQSPNNEPPGWTTRSETNLTAYTLSTMQDSRPERKNLLPGTRTSSKLI
jgi:hypothetical protein